MSEIRVNPVENGIVVADELGTAGNIIRRGLTLDDMLTICLIDEVVICDKKITCEAYIVAEVRMRSLREVCCSCTVFSRSLRRSVITSSCSVEEVNASVATVDER
jgi:hypothetical protein